MGIGLGCRPRTWVSVSNADCDRGSRFWDANSGTDVWLFDVGCLSGFANLEFFVVVCIDTIITLA